jgi:hypothetical protein
VGDSISCGKGLSAELESGVVADLVEVVVFMFIIHGSRDEVCCELFGAVEYDLASQKIYDLQEMLSLFLG